MTAPHQYPHPPHGRYAPGPYAPAQYAPGPNPPGRYASGGYAPGGYASGDYAPGPYPQGPSGPGRGTPIPGPPRRTQPWVVALVVGIALVVLAGIVLAAGASTGDGSRATGPIPGAGQQGQGEQGRGQQGERGTRCPGGSLEGCYTEGRMQEFLGQAVTFVHGFSDDRWSRMPHPAGYQLIGPGGTAQSACGALDTMTYAYCPADDRIYIGQQQLWQFYSEIGDAAAVVGLAHEYGHHVQNVAGVPADRSQGNQVRHENQADCIAGAFVGWAKEQGFLEEGDARDISGLVAAIASSEDDPGRDHGTLAEREASMATGIRDGLPGCSTFYPQTPVHQAG